MPKNVNGVLRFDIDDPADLSELIRTGLIWRGGEVAYDKAIDYLLENPEAMNDKVPAEVRAAIEEEAGLDEEPELPSEDELVEAPPAIEEPIEEEPNAPLA
jgi:hypothetical protein